MTETSTIAGDDPLALEVAGAIRGGDVSRLQQLLAAHPDVELLDALLDAGAEIDAGGAVIARGTPLEDAVAFGQWNAARARLGGDLPRGGRTRAGSWLRSRGARAADAG